MPDVWKPCGSVGCEHRRNIETLGEVAFRRRNAESSERREIRYLRMTIYGVFNSSPLTVMKNNVFTRRELTFFQMCKQALRHNLCDFIAD